jgi:hypothetical protein
MVARKTSQPGTVAAASSVGFAEEHALAGGVGTHINSSSDHDGAGGANVSASLRSARFRIAEVRLILRSIRCALRGVDVVE